MTEEKSNPAAERPAAVADLKNREAGLLEAAKALRALSIYPPNHPQRANAASLAYNGVRSFLSGFGELSVQVAANGFIYNEQRLGENQPLVRELAREMHLRQIKSFSLRPELTLADFIAFLELILEDPERFRQGKYIEQWLQTRRIGTVWVNEIDFSHLVTMAPVEYDPEKVEEQKAEESSTEKMLLELLDDIDAENDPERFAQLMRQAEAVARPLLEARDYGPVWRLVAVISLHASPEGRPGPEGGPIRALALRTVQALVQGEFLQRLFTRYVDPRDNETESLHQVFLMLGPALVDLIIDIVSRSEAVGVYRPLLELGLQLGAEARPVLEKRLTDANPLAVRRALQLLGGIKARESVEAIKTLLDHRDRKVRKEAVLTLARFRGIESSRALVAYLQREDDPEVELLIVQTLGENKDQSAAPALVSLLKKRQLREDTVELFSAAVEALGKIGSREVLPELIRVLNSWKVLNRELGLQVRVKAAEALGRLGGESAMQALARYSRGKDQLGRACAEALAAMLQEEGTSGGGGRA